MSQERGKRKIMDDKTTPRPWSVEGNAIIHKSPADPSAISIVCLTGGLLGGPSSERSARWKDDAALIVLAVNYLDEFRAKLLEYGNPPLSSDERLELNLLRDRMPKLTAELRKFRKDRP